LARLGSSLRDRREPKLLLQVQRSIRRLIPPSRSRLRINNTIRRHTSAQPVRSSTRGSLRHYCNGRSGRYSALVPFDRIHCERRISKCALRGTVFNFRCLPDLQRSRANLFKCRRYCSVPRGRISRHADSLEHCNFDRKLIVFLDGANWRRHLKSIDSNPNALPRRRSGTQCTAAVSFCCFLGSRLMDFH
jgi:hypothetical protein